MLGQRDDAVRRLVYEQALFMWPPGAFGDVRLFVLQARAVVRLQVLRVAGTSGASAGSEWTVLFSLFRASRHLGSSVEQPPAGPGHR